MAKKTRAQTPVSAFIFLGLGVVIAVGGFGIVSFYIPEHLAVLVSGVTVVIGVALALIGVKKLRPPVKSRAKKKRR